MKVLIQNFDCKFINNLDSISNKHQTIFVDITNNIYQISQTVVPDIYILIAEKLSYEELHFCQNNINTRIIIYNHNHTKVEPLLLNMKHIKILNSNTIPILYNPKRYNNMNIVNKNIDYVYFLDNDQQIPISLKKLLLPNNQTHNIKLFNNRHIEHPQNLGFLTENDKSLILKSSINYICHNMFYAVEAYLSGCSVLDTELNSISIDTNDYQTYEHFFESMV